MTTSPGAKIRSAPAREPGHEHGGGLLRGRADVETVERVARGPTIRTVSARRVAAGSRRSSPRASMAETGDDEETTLAREVDPASR